MDKKNYKDRRRLSKQEKDKRSRVQAKAKSKGTLKKDPMGKYERLGVPLKPKAKEITYNEQRRKVNDKRRKVNRDKGH